MVITQTTKMTKDGFIQGLVEDSDNEDDGISSTPSKSFNRRRLEKQSRQFEQICSREVKSLYDIVCKDTSAINNLLEILVSRPHEKKAIDQPN